MITHEQILGIIAPCHTPKCYNTRREKPKHSAFTLIEVLIVLVIMGILAEMMMFSSGSVMYTSESVRCKNDRKVIQQQYMLTKISSANTTSSDILNNILEGKSLDKICKSGGTYYVVAEKDDRTIELLCSIHNAAQIIPDTEISRYRTDWEDATRYYDGTKYYRLVSAGEFFIVNGKKYVIYKDNFNGINWSYSPDWEGALSLERLCNSGSGAVEIKENRGDFPSLSDLKGNTFTKGQTITYKGEEYVCISDSVKIGNFVKDNNAMLPDNDTTNKYWFKIS